MGKKKSIVFITLITIILVALLFFSFVPFPINAVSKFNSFVGSSQLGMELGGGVETVYYPKGVISKAEYQGLADASKNYRAHKGIYIQNDNFDTQGQITDNFKNSFEQAFRVIQKRFEQKLYTNFSIFRQDDYSILVRVPKTEEGSSALFKYMSADGGIKFTNAENTSQNYINNNDSSLIKSASVFNAGDTGYGVRINLTGAGRERVKKLTEGATQNSTDKKIYLYVGTTELFSVQVTQQLDTSTLQVSGNFRTKEEANTIVSIINLARRQENTFSMSFTTSTIQRFDATMGKYTALILLLTLSAITIAAIVYLFIRYKGLGFVYLLSIVTFILALILCTTFIPTLVITPTSFIAIFFSGLLLTLFSKMSFDRIKEEFKKGKTLHKSIHDAFNKSAILTAEVHGALFVFATLCYAIATGMMQSIGLLFMIGIGLSAAVTLGLNRFYLYLTMPQAKNKIEYCNLRKEVIDIDDED